MVTHQPSPPTRDHYSGQDRKTGKIVAWCGHVFCAEHVFTQ